MNEEQLGALAHELGLVHAAQCLGGKSLKKAWPALCALSLQRLTGHGRFPDWARALSQLPQVDSSASQVDDTAEFARPAPRTTAATASVTPSAVEAALRSLGPWKKGPFEVFGTTINAEWRSDMKWSRVQQMASPLAGRKVLDVGTGNGYFLLRAAGDQASFTLGLEPSAHYAAQFLALQRCFRCPNIALLPVTSDEFVQNCAAFDTVMSMGVLYHRRSPLDHLAELKSFLRPGGELILETIVVPGEEGYSLVPEGRYAQMRNVWFLPTVETLQAWLHRLGFVDIETGPVVSTTSDEQRSTDWTDQPSLKDFLDRDDPTRTIEGHPAPARTIMVARVP